MEIDYLNYAEWTDSETLWHSGIAVVHKVTGWLRHILIVWCNSSTWSTSKESKFVNWSFDFCLRYCNSEIVSFFF